MTDSSIQSAWTQAPRRLVAKRVRIARSFWERAVGLLGRKRLNEGEGLWLQPCRSVHTIGMRFAIDVAFLDGEGRVLRTFQSLPPFRVTPVVRSARIALELPAGALAAARILEGDRIVREPYAKALPPEVRRRTSKARRAAAVLAALSLAAATRVAASQGAWEPYLAGGAAAAAAALPDGVTGTAAVERAALLLESGDPAAAAAALADSATWDGEAVRLRAEALAASSSPSARAELERLLAGDPQWKVGRYFLGRVLSAEGKPRDAEAAFAAVGSGPAAAAAQRERGILQASRGALADAAKTLRSALLVDSSWTEIHRLLADVNARAGRARAAAESYEKLLRVRPDDRAAKAALLRLAPGHDAARAKEREAERVRQPNRAVAPPPFPTACPRIRVGLASGVERIRFRCGSAFDAAGPSGTAIRGEGGTAWTVETTSDPIPAVRFVGPDGRTEMLGAPARVEPRDRKATIRLLDVSFGRGYHFAGLEDREFRGSLHLSRGEDGRVVAVNDVHLEEYLYGVLPSEMPKTWPAEALAAQAVAARSETLRKRGKHRSEGFDVCGEVHCAAYRGVRGEDPRTTAAVDATRGILLLDGDRPVDAVYHSHCGGMTQDSEIVWSGPGSTTLRGRPDGDGPPFARPLDVWRHCRSGAGGTCAEGRFGSGADARWMRVLDPEEIRRGLVDADLGDPGAVTRVAVGERGPGGFVRALEVEGSHARVRVPGAKIRRALGGLRSNVFTAVSWRAADGSLSAVVVAGAGWGHGVGLCQSGAAWRASRGEPWKAILGHYFAGASFSSVRAAGLCP